MMGRGTARVCFVALVGLLFCAAALVLLGDEGWAQTAGGAGSPGVRDGAGLTPEQRERFVEGAGKVAGLDRARIAAALKDPKAVAAVPVRSEVVVREGAVEAAPSASGDEGFRSAAATYCRTATNRYNLYNAKNELLLRFEVPKYFCWDYRSVTYAPAPPVRATITQKGSQAGWRYKGLLKKSDAFFYYDGSATGGHVSRRQGSFVACPAATGCISKSPFLRTFAYSSGTATNYNSA